MNIPWSEWLKDYGLWAVLIGTFLEGESILVAGAIAAQRGYMHIESVILAALIGSFSGDQLYFFLGRNYGRRWLASRPRWHDRVAQVLRLLDKYHAIFILSFRFLYGLRSVAPFVLGTSGVSVARFMPLNFLGAVMWSVSVGSLGYMLGEFDVSAWFMEGGIVPWAVAAGILGLGLGLWFARRVRVGRARRAQSLVEQAGQGAPVLTGEPSAEQPTQAPDGPARPPVKKHTEDAPQ